MGQVPRKRNAETATRGLCRDLGASFLQRWESNLKEPWPCVDSIPVFISVVQEDESTVVTSRSCILWTPGHMQVNSTRNSWLATALREFCGGGAGGTILCLYPIQAPAALAEIIIMSYNAIAILRRTLKL